MSTNQIVATEHWSPEKVIEYLFLNIVEPTTRADEWKFPPKGTKYNQQTQITPHRRINWKIQNSFIFSWAHKKTERSRSVHFIWLLSGCDYVPPCLSRSFFSWRPPGIFESTGYETTPYPNKKCLAPVGFAQTVTVNHGGQPTRRHCTSWQLFSLAGPFNLLFSGGVAREEGEGEWVAVIVSDQQYKIGRLRGHGNHTYHDVRFTGQHQLVLRPPY